MSTQINADVCEGVHLQEACQHLCYSRIRYGYPFLSHRNIYTDTLTNVIYLNEPVESTSLTRDHPSTSHSPIPPRLMGPPVVAKLSLCVCVCVAQRLPPLATELSETLPPKTALHHFLCIATKTHACTVSYALTTSQSAPPPPPPPRYRQRYTSPCHALTTPYCPGSLGPEQHRSSQHG